MAQGSVGLLPGLYNYGPGLGGTGLKQICFPVTCEHVEEGGTNDTGRASANTVPLGRYKQHLDALLISNPSRTGWLNNIECAFISRSAEQRC